MWTEMLWSKIVLIAFSSSDFNYSLLMNSHSCLCLSYRASVILAEIIAEMRHLHCFICDFCTIELRVPYICAYRNAVAWCVVKKLQHEHNATLRGKWVEMGLAKTKIVSLDGPSCLSAAMVRICTLLSSWAFMEAAQSLSAQVLWEKYTLNWFGSTGVGSCLFCPRRERSIGKSFLCHRSFWGMAGGGRVGTLSSSPDSYN